MDAGPGGGPLLRRLLNLAVILGSLAALAWLVATEHDQLGGAIAGVGHAKLKLVVAAFFCERVSMIAFARVQVRLLRAGGHRLNLMSALGIVFAGNALSVSVPIAGPGLAVAFTYRELERREISRPAAAFGRRHDLPADQPVARPARRLGSLHRHQRPPSPARHRASHPTAVSLTL